MILEGKAGLVFGIANERSLGWSIARTCHNYGAKVSITYAHQRLERRARPLAESINSPLFMPCDVSLTSDIDRVVDAYKETGEKLDFLVHSIAFAERDALGKPLSEVNKTAFLQALEISCYSLPLLVGKMSPLLNKGATIVTLSYLGSTHYVENYNVMGPAKAALESTVRYLAAELGPKGIRINTLSAGPVKTLSAAGIPGFRTALKQNEKLTALGTNIVAQDVGNAGAFLCSPLSSGITGTVLFVDNGAHFMRSQCQTD